MPKLTRERRDEKAAERAVHKAERKVKRMKLKVAKKENPAFAEERAKAAVLHSQHKERQIRLYGQTVGRDRQFKGSINSRSFAARLDDGFLLADVKDLNETAVYWTDGSLRRRTPGLECMGAGVTWLTKNTTGKTEGDNFFDKEWEMVSQGYPLGKNTGTNADAELYGVAAALGHAVSEQITGARDVKLVRIFTDDLGLLHSLRKSSKGQISLGPLLSARLPVQNLFDWSDWLVERGIAVELVWVKGHNLSTGNKMADRAAAAAVRTIWEGTDKNKQEDDAPKTMQDVPTDILDAGDDFANEWLWRANKRTMVPRYLDEETEVGDDMEDDEVEYLFTRPHMAYDEVEYLFTRPKEKDDDVEYLFTRPLRPV
jgi:ribonuclease HI